MKLFNWIHKRYLKAKKRFKPEPIDEAELVRVKMLNIGEQVMPRLTSSRAYLRLLEESLDIINHPEKRSITELTEDLDDYIKRYKEYLDQFVQKD